MTYAKITEAFKTWLKENEWTHYREYSTPTNSFRVIVDGTRGRLMSYDTTLAHLDLNTRRITWYVSYRDCSVTTKKVIRAVAKAVGKYNDRWNIRNNHAWEV